MSANRWELSRRALLRDLGLGAACLPLLQAGQARAAAPPKLLIVAAIAGYRMPSWLPGDGPLVGPLPQSSAPLEPHRGDLNFLHDLTNPGYTGCATCGGRDYATMYYGLDPQPGQYPQPLGPTVDQVIATRLGTSTVLRSFHATAQSQPSLLAAPGARYCFWAGAGQPIVPQSDPMKSYAELFAGAPPRATGPQTIKVLAERKSILDYVGSSLERFKVRLGREDRNAIDLHLGGVRELERTLQSWPISANCTPDAPPTDLGPTAADYPRVLASYLAIALAVLRCGLSRVVTVQLSDATGDQVDFSGFVPGMPVDPSGYKSQARSWADLAHNPVLGGIDQKRVFDEWWMTQLSGLITQMKATPDGGQTLFDSSVILWGNDMEDGATGATQKIPWLLAGRAGGYFKTGQCLGGQTTTSVLASLCEAMGVPVNPFGPAHPGLKA
jgi:hypothetical protein